MKQQSTYRPSLYSDKVDILLAALSSVMLRWCCAGVVGLRAEQQRPPGSSGKLEPLEAAGAEERERSRTHTDQ